MWRHTLQHHRAKALARRPIWLAVGGIGTRRLLPDKVKPALCHRTGLDRPGDLDMTALTRQRAIFRRVGAELVESHAEILHGVRLQRQQGTGERDPLLVAERFQMFLDEVEQARSRPFRCDQEVV